MRKLVCLIFICLTFSFSALCQEIWHTPKGNVIWMEASSEYYISWDNYSLPTYQLKLMQFGAYINGECASIREAQGCNKKEYFAYNKALNSLVVCNSCDNDVKYNTQLADNGLTLLLKGKLDLKTLDFDPNYEGWIRILKTGRTDKDVICVFTVDNLGIYRVFEMKYNK